MSEENMHKAFSLAPKAGGKWYLIVKRIFDVSFSMIACLVLALPFTIVCLLIVAETPGRPIFCQERVGKDGKLIHIWKLRSMVSDAHEHPERYLTSAQLEKWKREQKLDDDPRITKVGKLIRSTSLDEIPQFFNVLIGDLSVIGPRPVTLKETFEFGEDRDEFLSVKPGITGWWQVTEHNNATWENGDRQALELYYVRHASIVLDFRILVRTLNAMSRGR